MATKSKPPKVPAPAANGAAPAGDVLTLAEAAAFLRVPEEGLRKDAEAGHVPGRRVGGEWRFVRGTLLAWLSEPEPRRGPFTSGPELVEHIRRTGKAWGPESEREAEEFIAAVYAARKADPVGG